MCEKYRYFEEKRQSSQLKNIFQKIIFTHLPVLQIDFAIDGADEVDEDLTLIKGGGACFLLEKTVALRAKELVILGDNS
jgi:ribose 5-phosphate isomerase